MRLLRFLIGPFALVLMAAPAVADSDPLSKRDPKGDVTIFKPKFISKAQKKSIDIDKARITLLDNGKYRFEVRLKKLHRSAKWDQMVFFESTFRARDPQSVSLGFSVRGTGGAYAYNLQTEESCSAKVRRKARTVWVDMSARCAPIDGQTVRVDTLTGHYQTDAPPYSRDRLTLGRFTAP